MTPTTFASLRGNKAADAATSDPFIGEQETTDSVIEAMGTPDSEMVLEVPAVGPAVKSRMVAGILGVFLGGVGLHRFYLGYNRVGMWQVVLTLGSFIVAASVAAATGATLMGAIGVGIGAAMLGVGWGFLEGLAIAMGGLTHDAHGRPLRS